MLKTALRAWKIKRRYLDRVNFYTQENTNMKKSSLPTCIFDASATWLAVGMLTSRRKSLGYCASLLACMPYQIWVPLFDSGDWREHRFSILSL